ncbi:MAG: FmdB family zinc ribbon protein [candidate division WOR-3 bacterium]
MPIKEYQCNGCQEAFEVLLLNKADEKDLRCPKCGSRKLTLLLSAFAVAGTEKKVISSKGSCTGCQTKTCSTCK